MSQDFQSFLTRLDARGELARIRAEVDPHLEAGAIADRVSKAPGGGKGLLFENVKGATMPVAMNVFGSRRRMEMALGVDGDPRGLDAVAGRIEKLIQEAMPKPGASFLDKLSKLPVLAEVGAWMPKTVRKAPCQEVVWRGEEARLSRLPVLTTWPEDGGPFITLGLSHTRHKSGLRNMGMYRLQVYDDHTLGFHTQLHHDGARARHGYAPGERMPVAVSLGGDPALSYAATAPLPPFLSEIMFTGFLRGEGVEMVRCVTNDMEVPADSEIVIEGWVDPAELRREGPFGDHTGYYSLADDYPVLHVEAITHRKNPVYPATIVGRPPQEDAWLGFATERIFLPLLKMVLPEVVDMHLPPAGGFHNLAIVSIRKDYPGHAQKVMNAIWGTGQMMFTKGIVVVDADIDPHDANEVLFRVTSNVDPRRDLLFTDGPLDVLDHSSDRFAFGSKVGIDATRKSAKLDNFQREWPRDLVFPDAILERVARRWAEYGI
ncbi:menaquinone biosynthesis decarboxylase [Mesoterricola silvestris]|uniref:Menaquinone biosynthesis decarboxylase n=1 Tax=Mesoterricola silvestris TaxID=2927979 RepID=A0AA48GH49_9BACT|nr:menaquinone biosynthesis decarboxylase [Mesoterricola silvestris]BDU70839.1 menaquinone biosynthesis decarboxylase [Mesoterricola silvestris]